MKKVSCDQCGKEYSPKGIGSHKWRSHGTGFGFAPVPKGTGTVWNKGLTIEDRPDLAEKLSAGGRKISEKLKSGLLDPNLYRKAWTEDKRKAQSERKINLYQEKPELHPNRVCSGNRQSMTYPEKLAAEALESLRIPYERNKKIGRRYPDFTVGNLCIEIDGEYWHQDAESDRRRDKEIEFHGYSVVRIRTSENISNRIKELFKDFTSQ